MKDYESDDLDEYPYQQTSAYQWTERAFDLLDSGALQGDAQVRDQVVSTRVWGPCPRCGHPLDDQQVPTAITNLFSDGTRSLFGHRRQPDSFPAEITVDVSCGCGNNHHGAPDTAHGCGVSFRVILPLTCGTST